MSVMDAVREAIKEPAPPKLKNVELVRQRIARGQSSELVRLRSWLSGIDGNNHAVDKLHGTEGELLVADIIELVLTHLGHTTEVTRLQDGGSTHTSQARKAARGSM